MTIDVQSFHDRVTAKPVDDGERVRGGIMPHIAKDMSPDGEVVAAHDTEDRIWSGKYDESQVKIFGEELLNMREDARNDYTRWRDC